ncbi:hypothetical protein EUB48_17185 [Rhodoferax sediminis]|uniref:Energy transducer TonB n=1 Tax=Rhodoferax sediminis TaxID=2509614 RepID=A0A515DHF8_9BURK|nr:hypothetical protein EUB48_17185 [Rhodoferax sediminis]
MNRRLLLAAGCAAAAAALIAGCKTAPRLAPAPVPAAPTVPGASAAPRASNAATAREYRLDAAHHLYALNADRIYKGKMPPMLYAVGVLQVDLDGRGRVLRTRWMRAPTQAPEVIAEIERTVRQAAPFPAPLRLGRVTYTDVWLWDKSGRFQLDTLTEGQLGEDSQ